MLLSEYDSANNDADRQANLVVASLGNEAASDSNKAGIKKLGEFALDI